MGFFEAVKTVFKKGITFQGRSSRSEHVWFSLFALYYGLFQYFVLFFSGRVSAPLGMPLKLLLMYLQGVTILLSAYIILLFICVAVRRLHDVNKSGWFLFLIFSIIGVYPVMYWLEAQGDKGPNRFGEGPLGTE